MDSFFKRKNFIVLFFFIISVSCYCQNQVSQKILFDSKSIEIKNLFTQKKYSEVLGAINKLILKEPNEGVNYFSRAVVNFYKNEFSTKTDTSLINDCVKAEDLGYSNPELNYLLFIIYYRNIDFVNIDQLSYENATTLFEIYKIDMFKTREQIDAAIKTERWNQKYIIARMFFLGKIFNAEINGFTNQISDSDLEVLETDCKYLIRSGKEKKDKAKAYWYVAHIELIRRSDTSKAISAISNAIENTPNDYDLYYQRGKLKSEMNFCSGALDDFSTLINRKKTLDDYEDAGVVVRRAKCYYKLSKDSLAVVDYTRAIKMFERRKELILKKNNSVENMRIEGINISLRFWYYERGIINAGLRKNNNACDDLNKAINLGHDVSTELLKKVCR